MATILEGLRERVTTAQKRVADAQQRFASAQAEFVTAQAEYTAWNNAYNLENREESLRTAIIGPLPLELTPDEPEDFNGEDHAEEIVSTVNKTDVVRELVRLHPNGITPADLWKGFRQQLPGTSRQYLYSVLKRLRDRDQICIRRGKYVVKVKPQEVVGETATIQ